MRFRTWRVVHTLVPEAQETAYNLTINRTIFIMYKNRSRGFTLIELLVVIAIIGILSSVVLASLNTARSKGNDAAIQSNLGAIATQAEIYYSDTNNTYGAVSANCVSGMWIEAVIARAITATDVVNGTGVIVCGSSATTYAIAAQMVADGTKYWCIDSSGTAKKTTALTAGATVCP